MSFLLHLGATVLCPHGGQAMPTSASTRVFLGGQPAVNLSHSYVIAGCPFVTGSNPSPCAQIQWTGPATRVRIEGAPAILSTSSGIAIGPSGPQGSPQGVVQQTRAQGQ